MNSYGECGEGLRQSSKSDARSLFLFKLAQETKSLASQYTSGSERKFKFSIYHHAFPVLRSISSHSCYNLVWLWY